MSTMESWVDGADAAVASWSDQAADRYTGRRRYTGQICSDPTGHRAKATEADERAGAQPETSWRLAAEGRCTWCHRALPAGGSS